MELSGKVIIFENEEEAKKWFEAISEVAKTMRYNSVMYEYETKMKELADNLYMHPSEPPL